MKPREYKRQLSLALRGMCFGFSKVKDSPDAGYHSGVFVGLMTCLRALEDHPIAQRALRELAEGNVGLVGMTEIVKRFREES